MIQVGYMLITEAVETAEFFKEVWCKCSKLKLINGLKVTVLQLFLKRGVRKYCSIFFSSVLLFCLFFCFQLLHLLLMKNARRRWKSSKHFLLSFIVMYIMLSVIKIATLMDSCMHSKTAFLVVKSCSFYVQLVVSPMIIHTLNSWIYFGSTYRLWAFLNLVGEF